MQQPKTSHLQRTVQPNEDSKSKQSPGRWVVIESTAQPQYQQPTTTIGPIQLPGTTMALYPDSYLYDYPSLFPDPFYFDYDYFFFPNFFSGTPSPTATYGYSGNKRSTFASSTEEPEHEVEENHATSTSMPTASATGENEIEEEDITTTQMSKVSGGKIKTTTEKPVTEEIEPEDRTTPSSGGQKQQETTTMQNQENEAEGVTKKMTTVSSPVQAKLSMSNSQKSQKKETNSVQYTEIKALQNGSSGKRYPPKYRFANNQGQFRYPIMKEVNVKPRKVKSQQIFSLTMQGRQQNIPRSRLDIKAKGVFKSAMSRSRVKTSNVQSIVVPREYSYVTYISTYNPSISSTKPLGPVRLSKGIHMFGQKCREYRKCSSDLKPVCGTDGLSYRNKCKLHKVACL